MAKSIQDMVCFTEVLDQNKQWVCEQRYTFEMATAKGNNPWPEMMTAVSTPEPLLLALLAVGVNSIILPYGFASRMFPNNTSPEVRKIYQYHLDLAESKPTSVVYPSYLTREELETKTAQLFLIATEQALTTRTQLLNFIEQLPDYVGSAQHQRIVFWFN